MAAATRKILVLLDSMAPHRVALPELLRLAPQERAEVELYDCGVDPPLPAGWTQAEDAAALYQRLLRERRQQDLERLAQPLRDRGIAVATAACGGRPLAEAIARHIERTAPDLVVIDDSAGGGPAPWRAQAEGALSRHARCPVLAVDEATFGGDDTGRDPPGLEASS